jgi:hypothetical protein
MKILLAWQQKIIYRQFPLFAMQARIVVILPDKPHIGGCSQARRQASHVVKRVDH